MISANKAIKRVECMDVRDQISHIKYKNWLIVRLKAIKFKEDIFYNLSF